MFTGVSVIISTEAQRVADNKEDDATVWKDETL